MVQLVYGNPILIKYTTADLVGMSNKVIGICNRRILEKRKTKVRNLNKKMLLPRTPEDSNDLPECWATMDGPISR